MHINEGKGKLALFYSANNVLVTPLLFIFIFLLLHNFIIFLPQYFYSLLQNFTILIFSLLLLLISSVFPPPPSPLPHFYCFPSPTATTFLLLSLYNHHSHHISFVFFPLPNQEQLLLSDLVEGKQTKRMTSNLMC